MAITIPLRALLPYALGALDYLFRQLLPPASPSVPVGSSYTPPFVGGQCPVIYRVILECFATIDGVEGSYVGQADFNNPGFTGAITGAGFELVSTSANGTKTYGWYILTHGGTNKYQITSTGRLDYQSQPTSGRVNILLIQRKDGQPDNCGNVSNPTPTKPVSDSGIADSGSPNLENNPIVQAGIPVLAIPSFMSALLAALNAAKSASDALAAVRAIAEAIEAIADLLNALKDKADKDKKKDDPNNKEITRNDFGSIRFDGYLRLYPSTGTNEREAIYIDLQLLSIPIWYGKYFGKSSPNFYRFKSLGYISFTSPTFGIIETKEIEFSRMSLNVPSNASGFFYHLGLDGDIVGNISAFYQKPK